MTEPEVRPACFGDLRPLAEVFGDHGFFIERHDRQKNGKGMLFVALLDGRPVGDVYLWQEEAEEAPIRAFLPGVPLLTHLEVRPDHRNRGIGTAIVECLENHLREQKRDKVALAVRTDNVKAAGLYARLGYRDWGNGEVTCHTAAGEEERCQVMVKDLLPASKVFRTFHEAEFGEGLLHTSAAGMTAEPSRVLEVHGLHMLAPALPVLLPRREVVDAQ